jgi:dTDP-4-amino-4,6-dideoxygalactose transaminase
MDLSSEDREMRDIEELFTRLGRSKFRSRFRLSGKEAEYFKQKGIETILEHARDFITKRLAEANPANDGKQTPMRNHPVFVAQHATGTCCRKCLEKWHHIPMGKPLTQEQIDYIIEVLKRWLSEQNI